jgi:small subunit ribosomal protein S3
VQKAMRANAKGIKIISAGRLGGAEIARVEKEVEGSVPLQTLRANIDYGVAEAHTTFGVVGIKVWIYKGDVLPEKQRQLGMSATEPSAAAVPATGERPPRPGFDRGGERGPRGGSRGGPRPAGGSGGASGGPRGGGERRPAAPRAPRAEAPAAPASAPVAEAPASAPASAPATSEASTEGQSES